MLTQQQIDESGQAINEAMDAREISVQLRGRLIVDLRMPTVGDAELIAATREIMKTAYVGYRPALAAYLAILTGSAQPSAPQPSAPTPSAPAPQPPATTSPAPSSGGPVGAYQIPMRPLTNGEQRNVIDAVVRVYPDLAASIEAMFARGFYPVSDVSIIDPVKFVYYKSETPAADKAAIKLYLSAIDQRDLQTNALLGKNDPRIVAISGSAQSTAPAQAPTGSVQTIYAEGIKMVNPETGFTIQIFMSKNDDGLRVGWNFGDEKGPPYGTHSVPNLPQQFLFIERDGGISFNAVQPKIDVNGNPMPKGQYDGLGGKDLIIYPGGYNSQGQKGRYVDIACMQAGRGIRIGTSEQKANPQFHFVMEADGTTSINGR